jgi:hypothetical protein
MDHTDFGVVIKQTTSLSTFLKDWSGDSPPLGGGGRRKSTEECSSIDREDPTLTTRRGPMMFGRKRRTD